MTDSKKKLINLKKHVIVKPIVTFIVRAGKMDKHNCMLCVVCIPCDWRYGSIVIICGQLKIDNGAYFKVHYQKHGEFNSKVLYTKTHKNNATKVSLV